MGCVWHWIGSKRTYWFAFGCIQYIIVHVVYAPRIQNKRYMVTVLYLSPVSSLLADEHTFVCIHFVVLRYDRRHGDAHTKHNPSSTHSHHPHTENGTIRNNICVEYSEKCTDAYTELRAHRILYKSFCLINFWINLSDCLLFRLNDQKWGSIQCSMRTAAGVCVCAPVLLCEQFFCGCLCVRECVFGL